MAEIVLGEGYSHSQITSQSPPLQMRFILTVSGDSGMVEKLGPTYPPSVTDEVFQNVLIVKNTGAHENGGYDLSNVLLRFDTSGLPDNATITGAVLRLWLMNPIQNANSVYFTGEWYSSSNWPIDISDWTYEPYSGAFAILLSSMSDVNNIALTTPTNINLTGYTGFRLHLSGGQPNGSNEIDFYGMLFGDLPPSLTVTYTVPPEGDTTPPDVTAFTIPSTSSSLTVAITTFTATDDVGVTGYIVTDSLTPPDPSDPGWSGTPPSTYVASSEGENTLYAWAKDAAGNVSANRSDSVVITLPPTNEEFMRGLKWFHGGLFKGCWLGSR
jgi:hypothetical protein